MCEKYVERGRYKISREITVTHQFCLTVKKDSTDGIILSQVANECAEFSRRRSGRGNAVMCRHEDRNRSERSKGSLSDP